MFDFFKKKQEDKPVDTEASGPVAEKRVTIDNVFIHAMPERFRNRADKMNNAKTTGLVIIAGGIVVLILASAALYYFLFRQSAATVNKEEAAAVENVTNEKKPAQEKNTETEATTTEVSTFSNLPTGDGLATTTASTTEEVFSLEEAINYVPAMDSDLDNLTDTEEGILNTSSSTPDTDGDGYLDGAEVANLYDPVSAGKLKDNQNITSYENKTFNYSVLYPKSWQRSVNGGDDSVMFRSADNQFIQIIVQPNSSGQTLDQWYVEQLGAIMINEADRMNSANWQGIKSADGMTLYIMDKKSKYIFSLTYNPGGNSVLEYINLYQMIIKSFDLKN